jgi:two-component system response regulator FixJ
MSTEAVVHVIDDDAAARESLEFLLQAAKIPVQTYESATAFLAHASKVSSGCVVTDVRMPEISGIDLLRRLKSISFRLPVIVMTGHGDVALAVEAMKIGAVDFFEKPFDDDLFLAAVRAALDRRTKDKQREADKADIQSKLAAISPRERQVLEGLVAGRPNKAIAFDLGISPRTVEIYRANVMTKMGATSLSGLVRMALVAGVLDPTEG